MMDDGSHMFCPKCAVCNECAQTWFAHGLGVIYYCEEHAIKIAELRNTIRLPSYS